MNEKSLSKKLSSLALGKIRYFESIGSTNDEALAWTTSGAPDLSIVIADEQTAGRGRLNRKWFTPKGTALAFSLILHPPSDSPLSRAVGLAALSIVDALSRHGLAPRIKWPNDILLNGEKVAGILTEAVWSGTEVDSLVVGMGINVLKESVPPSEYLQFPATSIENQLAHIVDREEILHDILTAFIARRLQMETDEFIRTWEELLAFRGQQIQVRTGDGDPSTGELFGLDLDGGLQLRTSHDKIVIIRFGDVTLRPFT